MKTVVDEAWKEACTYGTMTEPPFLDVHLMFEDVFEEMPEHLKKQQDELLSLEAGQS
jgi:TPP-dependent pyruvate/acetoin dehydrogenase alpha subunit